MKQHEPKECDVCGEMFVPTHGRQQMCRECREALILGRGRKLPRTYEGPKDFEAYEKDLRERNIANYVDRIVAVGYADRQRAETLKMVGKVEV